MCPNNKLLEITQCFWFMIFCTNSWTLPKTLNAWSHTWVNFARLVNSPERTTWGKILRCYLKMHVIVWTGATRARGAAAGVGWVCGQGWSDIRRFIYRTLNWMLAGCQVNWLVRRLVVTWLCNSLQFLVHHDWLADKRLQDLNGFGLSSTYGDLRAHRF